MFLFCFTFSMRYSDWHCTHWEYFYFIIIIVIVIIVIIVIIIIIIIARLRFSTSLWISILPHFLCKFLGMNTKRNISLSTETECFYLKIQENSPVLLSSGCKSSEECQCLPLTSDKKKSYDTNCVPNLAEVESAPTVISAAWGRV